VLATDEITQQSDYKCMRCFITLDEEQKLNGHGLIKVIDNKGKDNYICTNCLSGW